VIRARWIAFALAIVILAGCGGSHHKAEDDSPLVTAPVTAARPPSTNRTTTTLKLPVPAAEPADPYAPTPIVQIGTIEIPKIHLVHPVYEGITLTVIDHGPSHWPDTAMPCEIGNTVFPGHRVTHTHPFLDLDQLMPGDQIVFHMKGRDCVYAVTGTMIVQPDANYVVDQTPARTVTLIACHPKHSAAQRIVVKGKFVADIPRPT
jgi:LPXTG-site transpeptidase (sortase) family protein